MQRPNSETVTLNDILITEELSRRSPRPPNLQAENQAMRMLAAQMAQDSESLMQTLADMALELCQAGTAGVSLLETTSDGEEVFRWNVLAGTLAHHVGGSIPRNFSPCGVCLEQGTPVLFSHPERYFTDFKANTPIVESLVLPLIANSHVLGTIWILSHDENRQFDAEDVRMMTSLADFTATALLLQQRQTRELLAANAVLETEIAERKQTEAQLSEAQRRLELSLTGANLGAWTYKVSTDEFWADDRALQLHGHEPGEVRTFAEAGVNIHPDDRDQTQEALAQAIQTCSKVQVEYSVIWRDASVHWIASYAEFMPSGTQDEGMFYGIVLEITERKQSEAALRESEKRLRVLIENLPGGAAFVVDHELRYLLAEGEALYTAGFKPEDLVGKTVSEAMPPELVAHYEAVYRSGLAGESFEFEHHAHDRTYISRGTPLRSPNGDVYAVLAVSYDITERKQREAALRESEERLRLATEAADMYAWEIDLQTGTPKFSENVEQVTGKVPTHNFEENLQQVHPDDRAIVRQAFEDALTNGDRFEYEMRSFTRDNQLRWFLVSGSLIRDAQNRPVRAIGISQNITERKRAEEALRESEELLATVIETLPIGIGVMDINGTVVLSNQEIHRFLQNDVMPSRDDDYAGRWIGYYPDGRRVERHDFPGARALRGERVVPGIEMLYTQDDGSEIWTRVAAVPIRDGKGRITGQFAVVTDIDELKRSVEALRESEERFRLFVTASSDMVYRMSADWREMRNLEGKNILVSTETPSHTWFETYIPHADQSQVWAVIQEAIRAKSTFELEHRVIQQDGTIGWTFSRAIPLLNEQGEIVEWFGAASDVTERKRTEATLRESEEKYRSLFDSIDEGFTIAEVIYDPSGQPVDILYLEANPAASRMTGVPDYTRRRLSEISPNFEPYWVELYDRIARSGVSERTEQYAAPLGHWYEFYVFRVEAAAESDESCRVAVIFQDITDRKRAEEQLRRAAEMDAFRVRLSEALRSLTDPVQIQAEACCLLGEHLGVDRAYYVEVNEVERYARINQNYLRGDSPSLVGTFRLADYGWVVPYLQRGETIIVADTQTSDIVPETDCAAMAAISITAHISTPLIKAGALVGALCVTESAPHEWSATEIELVRETTERIWATIERARAEAALRESELQRVREQSAREQERQRAEALAELDRAKTIFFSNVSHEFRTPLTLSLAPLQDALSDRTHPLDLVQRERLELAHRNSLRLLKLVNTLLDFSRIEAGRIEAVYEPTDLAMFTTELASVFRSAIERAGLQLIVDCPPLPEPVFVDREMWEKIVLNLLSNAFKFTFEGEIRVSLRSTNDAQAILQIQDTGTGIAPEHLPHLCERFYQVRGTQARTHDGSGIGLALVHELVRLQGGTIEVSSTLGEGTCFVVSLPFGTEHLPSDRLHFEGDRVQPTRTLASTAMSVASYVEEAEQWLPEEAGEQGSKGAGENKECPRQSAQRGGPPHAAGSSASSARVLLVDDNADMREYLMRILSQHVQVEAVADGATALAVAQARVPNLILSDVMMPGLDGFELLQALRSDPRTREVPIILLSARAGEEAIIEGLEAGADDYLFKPFSAQELVSRVNTHLQMAQLRGEALQAARSTIRSRDEFISVVSHELNTPLVSILGWTRLLRANPPSPTMLTKALDTIERNATLQGKLVQDLLDVSRISAGKLRLNPQPIELKPVIETAIATVTQTAAENGINLIWQQNVTGSVVVMGDSDRLGQVLINLLTNAIKFTKSEEAPPLYGGVSLTPTSGSVTLELTVVNDDDSADASYAEIRVIDTGIGIAADFLPHVFDRFRQAEGANAAKGLGLGLAIARHIVELHNGTIHADSAGEGRGATFTVRLPLFHDSEDGSVIYLQSK